MTVDAIEPHGFCQGVKRALRLADAALSWGTVFCLHPLVHNEIVAAGLEKRGLRSVASPDELPYGATVLFSAHGVSPAVRDAVEARSCRIVDATCPFVARIHCQAVNFARRGVPVVVIGHAGHAEVQGIVGEVDSAGGMVRVICNRKDTATLDFPEDGALGVLCQTTFDADAAASIVAALAVRYPRLERPPAADVCTATRDRQDAVRAFVRAGGDGVLVLGSAGSSNTMRLMEIARAEGARFAAVAGTVADAAALDFAEIARLGVTAGASTPDALIAGIFANLAERGFSHAGTSRNGNGLV